MDRQALIESILALSFIHTYHWKPPTVLSGVGPSFPDAFAAFEATNLEQIEKARRLLDAHSDGELNAIKMIAKGQQAAIKPEHKIHFLNTHVAAKKIMPPPWYAGGFCVEGHFPDYEYWVRMKNWSLDDATALSLGYEPFIPVAGTGADKNIRREVLDFYGKRRNLIENNFYPFGSKTIYKPSPATFCDWAEKTRLEVPPELFASMSRLLGQPSQPTSSVATILPEHLESRERNSLLLFVKLLAEKFYNYDPQRMRSDVANQIQSDLNLMGYDMHPETIRKYVREAAAIPPKDSKAE
jgi:hypothetical protein